MSEATTPDAALTCDYCADVPEFYDAESAGEPPICGTCARDHWGRSWRSVVGKIGPRWYARRRQFEAS